MILKGKFIELLFFLRPRASKMIIIGNVGTGKSCLVQRFVHNSFSKDYKATIGVDFEVEQFEILGMPFNLQIWDTAGQERFKCIASGKTFKSSNFI
jgi:Ras-related protein Rab-34